MTEPLRIVRIIARLNVGGPARHVVWLTESMAREGFETTLVTGTVPPGEDDMNDFAARHGVVPLVIPEMSREISPADVITAWKLYRLFRRVRPHVVHTHTSKAGAAGRLAGFLYRWLALSTLAGRPRRVRFIHTFHGHIFHSYYGRLKTGVFLAIERALARMTDRILVLSPQQLHEINGVFRVGRREQFRIVPLGLDLEELHGDPARGAALRRELSIGADETVVGIVGRLTPIKNHEMFLRVAGRVAARRPGVRFVVFGDGSERARLEAMASAVAPAVVFAGTRRAGDVYAALDIAALTSLNEGTPLTLIEAISNGRTVISTRVGGVEDVLGVVEQEGKGFEIRERGVTTARGDDDGFVRGLERLLDDPALCEHLGGRGRTHAATAYSKQRLVTDIIAVTRELAG